MTKKPGPSVIERTMEDDVQHSPDEEELTSTGAQNTAGSSGKSVLDLTDQEQAQRQMALASSSARPVGSLSPILPATLERNHIIAGSSRHEAVGRFNLLRTQILQEMTAKGWRTLGITSPTPLCGKTTVAINLCISIAKGIRKDAVLVDLNLRNPSIANYLGIDSSPDLSDLLEGDMSFLEPIVNTGIPRLLIIPNKRAHFDSSDMLTSEAAVSLARNLRAMESVQIVVYDLPSVLPTDDVLAFLPQLDCVLIVLAEGSSTKQDLVNTKRMLKHANVLGYVLNQF
jgi:protein-tyrosine kinase